MIQFPCRRFGRPSLLPSVWKNIHDRSYVNANMQHSVPPLFFLNILQPFAGMFTLIFFCCCWSRSFSWFLTGRNISAIMRRLPTTLCFAAKHFDDRLRLKTIYLFHLRKEKSSYFCFSSSTKKIAFTVIKKKKKSGKKSTTLQLCINLY